MFFKMWASFYFYELLSLSNFLFPAPLSGCHQLSHLLECTEHCGVHNIQPTECTVFFLWYSYYNITVSILHVSIQKYVSGLWDTVKSPVYLYNSSTKSCLDFTTWLFYTMLIMRRNSEFSVMQYYLFLVPWWWFLVDWNMLEYSLWYYNINI
jgi:hypothetical protein